MPNGLLGVSYCRVAGAFLAVATAVMLAGCGDSASSPPAPVAVSSTVGTISPATGNTTSAAASTAGLLTAGSGDPTSAAGNASATITISETTTAWTPVSDSLRQALLSWSPPLLNTDGSELEDLAGYRLYCGQDPEHLVDVADLAWGGYLWVKFTDLTPGDWYFSIRSYNSEGIESDFAPMVNKEVV